MKADKLSQMHVIEDTSADKRMRPFCVVPRTTSARAGPEKKLGRRPDKIKSVGKTIQEPPNGVVDFESRWDLG